MYALDIETASLVNGKPYALEPYRLNQNLAEITSVSVYGDRTITLHKHGIGEESIENIGDLIKSLAGQKVVAHFAVFDVAWLIAEVGLDAVRRIVWQDTSLLAKWIYNGQRAEIPRKSYSLRDLVEEQLVGHELYDEFLSMKDENQEAGVNDVYWLNRGKMDAHLTYDLYHRLMSLMPKSMLNQYNIEQRCIVPVANSWLVGIKLDIDGAKAIIPKIRRAKDKLSEVLGISEKVIASPKQLSKYLFTDLGIEPLNRTPTGSPKTSADDLKRLAMELQNPEHQEIIKRVLDFKQIKTLETKFINGIIDVNDYNLCDINHSSPRIFSTYTGRFTYSSKTESSENRCGIATHQLPRKGPTRGLLKAPDGYVVGELDAAQQELRGMAIESLDENLIAGFNDGLDLHSGMAADIAHKPYQEFVSLYESGDAEMENYRYAGKLLNLSCQYRIGHSSLADKFFTTYGIVISKATASYYLSLYKNRYPGVREYWTKAINIGKDLGYAETIGGRRFYLTDWHTHRWATESSAINFRIQGFGGDHKEVAISHLFDKYPEAIFLLDLHDGLWYGLPENSSKELLLDMRDYISNLPYEDIWNKPVPIALPFDAKIGTTFGNVKDLK